MKSETGKTGAIAAAALFGVYAGLLLCEAAYVGWMSRWSANGKTWAGPQPVQHAVALVGGAAAFVVLAFALATRSVRAAWLVGVTVSSLFGLGALVLLVSTLDGASGLPGQVLGPSMTAVLAGVTTVVLLSALVLLIWHERAGRGSVERKQPKRMTRLAERGDEANEAFGGTVTRTKCRVMPAPSSSDVGTASQRVITRANSSLRSFPRC
jgi:hypothetical protein